MRRTVQTMVVIDGEPVRFIVDRLTIAEYENVAALMYPRGTNVKEDSGCSEHRLHFINTHLEVVFGDMVDENNRPISRVGHWFGNREDIIALLFVTLLNAQNVSEEERLQLSIALHYTEWLQRAKEKELPSDWVRTETSCAKCHAKGLNTKRGCDGQEVRKIVWHYRAHRLRSCPVMNFTPDVERMIRLFYWSHTVRADGRGVPAWVQLHLPNGPVLLDQEAWSMSALSFLRGEANNILSYEMKKAADE